MTIDLINNYIEGFTHARSVDDIHQLCDQFWSSFGFDSFLFALRVSTSFTNSQMILINGFPAPWSDHYFEKDYLPKDPTVAYCTKNILPLTWHSPSGEIKLTEREKECLFWAAEGKTAWETSQILNVSERTINFHLTNTTKKLSVFNRPQAVAKAVFVGIISPYPF